MGGLTLVLVLVHVADTVEVYVGMTQVPQGGQVPGSVVVVVVGQQSVGQGTVMLVKTARAGHAMGVDSGGQAKHGTVSSVLEWFQPESKPIDLCAPALKNVERLTGIGRGVCEAAGTDYIASPVNSIDKCSETRARNAGCRGRKVRGCRKGSGYVGWWMWDYSGWMRNYMWWSRRVRRVWNRVWKRVRNRMWRDVRWPMDGWMDWWKGNSESNCQ